MAAGIDRTVVRSFELFSTLSDIQFEEVMAAASYSTFVAGKAVFEQGEEARSFFLLVNGKLRVTQVTEEGQQIIVRIVVPGDLFGIAPALQRPDYPGTASALSLAGVLGWPSARWTSFMSNYPSMAVGAMQTMGDRLQEAHSRLREMATEEVERRVAHTVLRLGSQSGRKEAGGVRIDFPVSKQDIAELSGTTLHTVSRILTAWEAAGLVEGGRQKLLLKNPHRLLLIGDGHVPGLL
jgi:CRP-like cAMP-binding protein